MSRNKGRKCSSGNDKMRGDEWWRRDGGRRVTRRRRSPAFGLLPVSRTLCASQWFWVVLVVRKICCCRGEGRGGGVDNPVP